MSAIQFEFEHLYELLQETREQKDRLATELDEVHNTLETTRGKLEEKRDEIDDLHVQLEEMRMVIRKLEMEKYGFQHRLECLMEVNRLTYEHLTKGRKENKMLAKQIDDLTNGTIKYKRAVDPDDLEEYLVDHKIYLRDVLTDAIYTRHGKLFGYIDEDTGELVKIAKK